MNNQARASEILRQARDVLAARLIERVVDSSEDILQDAQGETFLSEIEELYDQLGSKLHHVGVMLSQIPPAQQKPAASDAPASSADGQSPAADAQSPEASDQPPKLEGPAGVRPRLPAPSGEDSAAGDVSFRDFGVAIQSGDVEAASRCLAELFEVEPQRADRCAVFFIEAMNKDPQFVNKAMSLRKQLAQGSINSSLMLLYQCFGLQPYESIGVVQALKTRLA